MAGTQYICYGHSQPEFQPSLVAARSIWENGKSVKIMTCNLNREFLQTIEWNTQG